MEGDFLTPEKGIIKKVASASKTESPFQCLGNHSTPPSRFFQVRNPFDAALANRLHLPISSPSIFAKLPTKTVTKKSEKFRWTIEEIALLNPAPIDEHNSNQFDQPDDPEIERTAQLNIEKFFSNVQEIVPSPLDKPKAISIFDNSLQRDSSSQTILSLPPELPDHVEAALAPYYNTRRSTQPEMSTSLIKRLFHDSNEESIEEDDDDHHQIILSPIKSPQMVGDLSFNLMESPQMSPIGDLNENGPKNVMNNSRKSLKRLFDLVPDCENMSTTSIASSSSVLVPESVADCTYSSVNWDIENESIGQIIETKKHLVKRVRSIEFDEADKENNYFTSTPTK